MARVALAIALLAAAGCATQWSYRLLDWHVSGQLRDYVPMDTAQRTDFEQRLDTVLHWHRGTQLPLYSDWLRTLGEMVAMERISADQWRIQGERASEFWLLLMRRVQPHAVAVLAQLSDEQVAEFLANVEQRTEELEQEYQARDAQQRQQHRARRMEKSVKRWIGSVDPAQSARIEQWSAAVEDLSALSVDSRRHWTAAMAAALGPDGRQRAEPGRDPGEEPRAAASIRSTESLADELEPLLVEPSRLWPPAYKAAMEHNASETVRLLSDLHAMCSAEQRRHLYDALRSWSARLDRLAAGA